MLRMRRTYHRPAAVQPESVLGLYAGPQDGVLDEEVNDICSVGGQESMTSLIPQTKSTSPGGGIWCVAVAALPPLPDPTEAAWECPTCGESWSYEKDGLLKCGHCDYVTPAKVAKHKPGCMCHYCGAQPPPDEDRSVP